ncbi:MAG: heparinase II/III family protein, partial [Opitutaceae bacterium]|nr:heparinase II/III family protein [Opitutaceae bacterium]
MISCPWVIAAAAPTGDVLSGLRAGHPRLLFTDEQLAAALADAKIDPLRAQLHKRIVALAEKELGMQPVRRVLVGPRLLDKSRTALGRVLTCAMAFRLTKDSRFLDRAKEELFATADFTDWNPSHFLDVAEMSLAFAIGYDWLYDNLSPRERARLKAAMMEKSLSFAPAAYASAKPTDKRVWFVTRGNNWNQVCNAGLLAAALALAEDEPTLARLVTEGAVRSLPIAMEASYSPDGAYPEGPAYWNYGTGYNVVAIAMLESALGSDFGLSHSPGFDRTAFYRMQIESPRGEAFNYADGRASIGAQPQYTWLALRFNLPGPLVHCRESLRRELSQGSRDDRLQAMHAVWFPPAMAAIPVPPALDVRFRGPAELAIFRSAWNEPRALFLGFKAGRNDVNHAHLDLGSFVLDADGVRWAHDLGPDNYNLPDYFGKARWSYYRLNNHSHNT